MPGLAELQRLAYARESTPEERAAAEAALAALREPPRVDEPFTVPALAPARPPRMLLAALLGAAAGAGLVATVAVAFVPPAAALDVFERPATAQDALGPQWAFLGGVVQVRLLAVDDGRQVFGYLDEAGEVCIALVDGALANGTCTSVDEFARHGLALTSYDREAMDRIDRVRVTWSPDGTLGVAVETVTGP